MAHRNQALRLLMQEREGGYKFAVHWTVQLQPGSLRVQELGDGKREVV